MDGDFHNKVHSKSEYTIDDIKEIDKKKDILALKNGITMIRIDCSISEFDYIFNSIKNSILDKLFVLSKIDKVEINKKAYSSNIVDACKLYMTKTKDLNSISKILHIPYGTIYNYLKKGAEIGLCNYDPKFSLKYKGNLGFVGHMKLKYKSIIIYMGSSTHYSPTLGVELGKCNQAEMYGEHIEFDSLRFHYFACHITSSRLIRCFNGKIKYRNLYTGFLKVGFIMQKSTKN